MKYEQTSLVFELLMYNQITSKYMPRARVQRQKYIIQKLSAMMGNYKKEVQNEINLLCNLISITWRMAISLQP